ncbi:MAG TPA: CYCXC family (seleno)protein [Pyrinomonadaceae bacterium]|jgi:hypothetical protein|nr:CYCXC family (seleno)protein [Pyrinomonadaceae bacterium]
MKKVLIIAAIAGVALAAIIFSQSGGSNPVKRSRASAPQPSGGTTASRVPAHSKEVVSLSALPPTLPPERFFGVARQAYQVAREIPQTLAQLPCYCYCDETFGHKSLHTCYESEHSATCATCVSEALLAYRLQKEQGLTAPQIRERIIAEFSRQ